MKRNVILLLAVISVAITYCGFVFYLSVLNMQVWDMEGGKLLASYQVRPYDQVEVKFIHSYDRGAVSDYFAIQKDGSFLLNEVVYSVQSYDARDLTFPKASRTLHDGKVYLKEIDKFYTVVHPELIIRVPYTVPHWIILKNKEIELSSLAPSGKLLKIKAVNYFF